MKLVNNIYGKSIYLRSLDVCDAGPIYLSWLTDQHINQYLEVRFDPPRTMVELKKFVLNCSKSDDTLLLGIFLQSSDMHIGNVKLGPINPHHKTADLGFVIGDQTLWGKGFASQAILLASDYACNNLGVVKITAGVAAQNKGSQKALLNSGFALEGVLRSQLVIEGSRQDGYLYGKLRTYDDFKNQN
jgi:ribosomal-protein-alanine N-acetyltransferase